ncbi:MAG: methyl-accepting chemotaxis protein [Desulfobacteraceae bacterium]
MYKNMKLGTKLWCLTGLLLFAILIVAGISYRSIGKMLSSNSNYADSANYNTFMIEKEVDHLKWLGKVQDLFVNNEPTIDVQLDHTSCGLGKFLYGEEGEKMAKSNHELASLLNEIKTPHQHLHESGRLIKEVWKKNHPGLANTLAARLDDHRRWAASLSDSLLNNKKVNVQLDPARCGFGQWLLSEECRKLKAEWPEFASIISEVEDHHVKLHESAEKIDSEKNPKEKVRIYSEITSAELNNVATLFDQVEKMEADLGKAQDEARQIFQSKTLPAINTTQEKMEDLSAELNRIKESSREDMISQGSQAKISSGIITVIAFIVGGFLSFILIRVITKPINRIIEGLNNGAEQVVSAAGQVSSSSQQLAEGSSEQAASIEETSSSLEEMAAMTKQNADNANQANNLMKEAEQVVTQANNSMTQLTGSMEDISKASEETSKIIKTIDEIAFQTNLLALNAAVEAARAGEAGAGFAVVADEVRNLAMRAAEAAKNTADLIEGTVKKINHGSDLVTETNDSFELVVESATKVAGLVAEIAAASNEQSQGIDQVNTAVADMDKVVQQNAANAEESASASEEMNAQAEQMKNMVNELVLMVGRQEEKRSINQVIKKRPSTFFQADKGLSSLIKHKVKEKEHQTGRRPEDVIPLDEDDFKDF